MHQVLGAHFFVFVLSPWSHLKSACYNLLEKAKLKLNFKHNWMAQKSLTEKRFFGKSRTSPWNIDRYMQFTRPNRVMSRVNIMPVKLHMYITFSVPLAWQCTEKQKEMAGKLQWLELVVCACESVGVSDACCHASMEIPLLRTYYTHQKCCTLHCLLLQQSHQ